MEPLIDLHHIEESFLIIVEQLEIYPANQRDELRELFSELLSVYW